MADYVSDISIDSAEKKGAGGEDEVNPPQLDHHSLEESASPLTGDDRTGILSSEDTLDSTRPPESTSSLKVQVTPSTPTEEAETARRLAPTGRRVSFQVGCGEEEGEIELTRFVANRDGSIAPSISSRQTPSAATSTSSLLAAPPPTLEPTAGRKPGPKRRESEWVFRPLKLKFKVKELEELYRNYVYRQQLSLVFTACLIMVVLSLIVVISFFVNTKVYYTC